MSAADKVDFVRDIQPVLQQNCIKCHGPEKQKAHLRLDSRDAALEGGKNGPSLVAGDGAKSDLVRRISLPKTDDDFMPAEGEPLPKEQIALIKKWIDEGAVWLETAMPKESANAKPAGPAAPELPKDFKPSKAEQKAVAALAQKGIELRPIAMNTPWRQANLRLLGTSVNDATLASLKDVASLVDLNLATTKITDKGLESLKGLRNLRRLHLELTAVTDAGLAKLKPLTKLTYLNLYGTNVTDAGLEHLKGLRYLRNLYVWQSKVTDAGVKGLKAALPNVEVSTGWESAERARLLVEAPSEKFGFRRSKLRAIDLRHAFYPIPNPIPTPCVPITGAGGGADRSVPAVRARAIKARRSRFLPHSPRE